MKTVEDLQNMEVPVFRRRGRPRLSDDERERQRLLKEHQREYREKNREKINEYYRNWVLKQKILKAKKKDGHEDDVEMRAEPAKLVFID